MNKYRYFYSNKIGIQTTTCKFKGERKEFLNFGNGNGYCLFDGDGFGEGCTYSYGDGFGYLYGDSDGSGEIKNNKGYGDGSEAFLFHKKGEF